MLSWLEIIWLSYLGFIAYIYYITLHMHFYKKVHTS